MSSAPAAAERTVLIATNHADREVWQPIVNRLPPHLHTEVFEGDAVAAQRRPLKVELAAGGMHVWYDGRELALKGIRAALYLRPNVAYEHSTRWADDLGKEQARGVLYDTLWRQVPKDRWLNHPDNMRELAGLMGQLTVAERAGFAVPRTLATGDTGDITETFPQGAVHKTSPNIIFSQDGVRLLQSVHVKDVTAVPLDHLDPYTSYWQDFVDGTPWYAMAIGKQVYAASLRRDKSGITRYSADTLPAQAQKQCRDYLRIAGLGMASFSLVENEGTMMCVGVNPYGHPGWMANDLHQPVLGAIANELAAKAMSD